MTVSRLRCSLLFLSYLHTPKTPKTPFLKNYLPILFLCFLGLGLKAQTPYTNVINYIAHNGRPSIEVGGINTYYVANILNIWPDSYMQYAKLDTNGNVLDTLTILWDPTKVFTGNCPKCLHLKNGVLYHAYNDFISNVPGNDTVAVILAKIKPDLSDTIYHKYYAPKIGRATEARAMVFDTDSTFILTSISAYYTGDTAPNAQFKFNVLVSRIDTAFNVLWETIIPDSDSTRNYGHSPGDITLDSYGTMLVTGSPYSQIRQNEAFAARLRVSNGQLLWRRVDTGAMGIQGMYAVDHGDGTYRYVQNWLDDPDPVFKGFHKLHVGILDTNGNILQDKAYGMEEREHVAVDLIKLKDGNYYTAGTSYYWNPKGLGFKFTPNLDSLWMRWYWHDTITDFSQLDAFKEDSSGMIVHTGWHASGKLYNWLFRIDTRGCDTSNCNISIYEEPDIDTRWQVFPNPSSGPVTIDHPELYAQGTINIQVMNMQGAIIHNQDYAPSEPIPLQIPTSGSYYVIIRNSKNEVIGLKQVVVSSL
jgi:hypothetical protein